MNSTAYGPSDVWLANEPQHAMEDDISGLETLIDDAQGLIDEASRQLRMGSVEVAIGHLRRAGADLAQACYSEGSLPEVMQ